MNNIIDEKTAIINDDQNLINLDCNNLNILRIYNCNNLINLYNTNNLEVIKIEKCKNLKSLTLNNVVYVEIIDCIIFTKISINSIIKYANFDKCPFLQLPEVVLEKYTNPNKVLYNKYMYAIIKNKIKTKYRQKIAMLMQDFILKDLAKILFIYL